MNKKEHIYKTNEKLKKQITQKLEWNDNFIKAIQSWDKKLYNDACKYANEIKEGCI